MSNICCLTQPDPQFGDFVPMRSFAIGTGAILCS